MNIKSNDMANVLTSLLTLSLCLEALMVTFPPRTAASGAAHGLSWVLASRGGCRGSVGECLGGEKEYGTDSEISRRVLETSTKYISYGALQRDTIPCSQRGASYYNCQPGAEANPYDRGCSAITRCRG